MTPQAMQSRGSLRATGGYHDNTTRRFSSFAAVKNRGFPDCRKARTRPSAFYGWVSGIGNLQRIRSNKRLSDQSEHRLPRRATFSRFHRSIGDVTNDCVPSHEVAAGKPSSCWSGRCRGAAKWQRVLSPQLLQPARPRLRDLGAAHYQALFQWCARRQSLPGILLKKLTSTMSVRIS